MAVGSDQPKLGTADVTGDGLRVKAAIGRVVVLGRAGRAHRKSRHAGMLSVVGDAIDDAQARPAVRTVGEGIAETPRERIKDLLDAGGARGGIRGHARADGARRAGGNVKTGILRQRGGGFAFDAIDARQRRRLAGKLQHEFLDRGGGAADVNPYALAIVGDPAAQAMTLREAPQGRTKAHSLDQAPHTDQFRCFAHAASSRPGATRDTRLLPESAMTAMSP